MIFLAQGQNFSSSQIGAALGIALFVFLLIIAARKVFGHEPPLHKEFTSRTEAEFLKVEITKVDNERRTGDANLHARIERTNGELRAELTAKVEKLEGRIDAVPDRTIKLLRETKGLI